MIVVKENDANIGEILRILESGGLVVFPCETVYGIGCDCLSLAAVKRLTEYKQRPPGKPYAIMAANKEMAEEYVIINQTAENLYDKFLPGPLTIISTGKHKTATGVESGTGTLGVRIPNYAFMQELIYKFGRPITATSANASYKKRPYSINDILDNISRKQKNLIDLIIDAGTLPHNEPSTVIDTTLDDAVTLRQGDIVLSPNCEVLSRSEEDTRNTGKELWQKYEKHAGARAIVFGLEGSLGAGKTQFTKGLARAMGIVDEIISPSFNLELEYKIPNPKSQPKLIHIDAWRMQGGQELRELGLQKLINDKSVIVIEWADRVAGEIRKYDEEAVVVWVRIMYTEKENERIINWGVV
jgi:L-threonylcarbamoyladenylate synthase